MSNNPFIIDQPGPYLTEARNRLSSKVKYEMYRSRRTPSTITLVNAFSWLSMPILKQEYPAAFRTVGFSSYAIEKGIEVTDRHVQIETNRILESVDTTNSLRIHVVNTVTNKELGDACIEHLGNNGWTLLGQHRAYLTLTPYHRVELLKHIANSGAIEYILFSNRIDDEVWVRLSGIMLHDMNPLKDALVTNDLIHALGMDAADRYASIFEQACEKELGDKMQNAYNTLAEEVDTYAKSALINATQHRVTRFEREEADRLERYIVVVKQLREERDKLIGIRARAEAVGLSDFLKSCKNNITYFAMQDSRLYVVYKTPLLYWDEDMFSTLRNARNNNVIANPRRDDLNFMIKKVFEDKTHTLWMEEAFYIYLSGEDNNPRYIDRGDVPNPRTELRVRPYVGIENPHHKEFNCWGDNLSSIRAAIANADFTIALAQIFAAIAGINFSDSVVMDKLFKSMLLREDRIYRRNCIQDNQTKEFMTIAELYNRREQYETNEINEQASERSDSTNQDRPEDREDIQW